MDIEVTRGHKKFDSNVKNLEGILNKLDAIIDTSDYRARLEAIKTSVKNNKDFDKSMPTNGMQSDYESFTFKKYIKQIGDLTFEVERDAKPFYELHLLCKKIDGDVKNVNIDTVGQTIEDAEKLLELINELSTHNDDQKNKLIDDAYKTLYSVLLYEELFDRSDLIDMLLKLDVSANRENIGRFISNDLKGIDSVYLTSEELKHLSDSGLGYDFLTRDIIKKISSMTVGNKNSKYEERKNKAINEYILRNNVLRSTKDAIKSSITYTKDTLKKLNRQKRVLYAQIASFIMVPIITISAGANIGKKEAERHIQYKTITQTVDIDTKEIIDEPKNEYTNKETNYVATILIEDPWVKNVTGQGYTHTVRAYEFVTSENLSDDFHITREDLEGNVKEKYSYVEHKDNLDSTDSMSNSRVLVTETYQDKSDTRPNNNYRITYTILGILTGAAIDVALNCLGICSLQEIQRKLIKLRRSIAENSNEQIEFEERRQALEKEIERLNEIKKDIEKKYGHFDNSDESESEYTDSYTDDIDSYDEKSVKLF